MTTPALEMTDEERKRSLANLKLERDAIYLYDQLARSRRIPIVPRCSSASPRTSGVMPTSGLLA